MKVYHGRTDIERFEYQETPSQTVTHLVLPAGQATQHHVPYTVVVVPVSSGFFFPMRRDS